VLGLVVPVEVVEGLAGGEGLAPLSSRARYQATVSRSIPVAPASVRAASPFTAAPITREPIDSHASDAAATLVVLPAPARPIAAW
jgi:hypothetical protein